MENRNDTPAASDRAGSVVEDLNDVIRQMRRIRNGMMPKGTGLGACTLGNPESFATIRKPGPEQIMHELRCAIAGLYHVIKEYHPGLWKEDYEPGPDEICQFAAKAVATSNDATAATAIRELKHAIRMLRRYANPRLGSYTGTKQQVG